MENEKRLIKVCDATAVYNGIALYMAENAYLNDTALDVLKMVAKWLDEAPTVDAVEVVRCKDCKHFIPEEHGCNHFGYYSHTPWVDEVDFCSYGERRDGE